MQPLLPFFAPSATRQVVAGGAAPVGSSAAARPQRNGARQTVFGVLAVLAALASSTATVRSAGAQDPARATTEPWRIIDVPQATLVFARDGALLGEFGMEKRVSVPLASLPAYVPQAFIAVEDKRFYQHDGVDIMGVAAAIKDAATGGEVRGASTITQLLVGNMHPEIVDRRDRSISRKLREQQAARDMEKRYSKAQILEAFLNQIAFGRGWHGIELAARHYFGKGAADLTLAEAASLAAMPKSPVQYDPVRAPGRNRERRNLVLALMRDQGYITRAQASAAQAEPLRTAPDLGVVPAPWVVDVVRVQAERAGVPVMTGGYRIMTTIDATTQRAAVRALRDGLTELERRPGWQHGACDTTGRARRDCVEGAVVALDPASGDVRALVGGRDYVRAPFNRAVDGNRQPGSAFKPYVYATAIAAGVPASTLVGDTALAVPLPTGAPYSPENADRMFMGTMTLRESLSRSRNTVAVTTALEFGVDSVAALAARLGLRSRIAPFPSSALGASVVQPLDFVATYAAFANGGYAVAPRFIDRVVDRAGRTVHSVAPQPPTPAMDPRVAFIVRDMLRDAVERGTGTAARRAVPANIPVAGKTGTTNDNSDVWFVGMTPDLVAGAWLGFDTPRTITPGAAGGTIAAPIVGQLLGAVPARTDAAWTPPPGVVSMLLDRRTGSPATEATPAADRYTEWYLEGTEPGALPWPYGLFRLGPLAF